MLALTSKVDRFMKTIAVRGRVASVASRTTLSSVLVVTQLAFAGGVASAEPIAVADVAQFGDTVDGWRVNLALTSSTIDAVPNMAGTLFVKEGFVTGKATATIEGDGAAAINSGTLILGVQLGCQVSLNEGIDLGIGNSTDVVADDAYLNISPYLGVDLRPGSIRTLGLGQKSLKGRTGVIFARDAHVQIEGCGGPVSIRLFTSMVVSTDTSDDKLNAYGDVLRL